MYVIQEGEVEIRIRGHIVEMLGPGDIFGELALIDDAPRNATAIARTDSRVIPIDQKRFTFLVQQTPYFALKLMQTMSRRLRDIQSV
jgi:CRP-like cAMP-binding protein